MSDKLIIDYCILLGKKITELEERIKFMEKSFSLLSIEKNTIEKVKDLKEENTKNKLGKFFERFRFNNKSMFKKQ